jgi:hypothetical protein
VGVDDEGAPADTAAKEVVARVADDQAQVVLAGEVDAGLNMGNGLGLDEDDWVVTEGAGIGGVRRRAAGVVGEVGPQAGRRQLNSGRR